MNSVENYRSDLVQTLSGLDLSGLNKVIDVFAEARRDGRTIFVAGNGGSAASASHFVCDVIKGASYGRESRFRILSLNDNFMTMTAYANDVSYDVVFVEPLKNYAKAGDVFLAISGSGNSPNVVKAMEFAREAGLTTVAMTGRTGGKLGELAEHHLHVANSHMGRIEDVHMMMCHMIAYHFMETEVAAS